MSPLSEFPESKKEYKTFAEYYDKNYNIKGPLWLKKKGKIFIR